MTIFRKKIRFWLQSTFLLVVAANLVLVSVPRCEFIYSLLHNSASHSRDASSSTQSCHASQNEKDDGQSHLSSDQLCKCSLLCFMPGISGYFDIRDFVQIRPRASWRHFFDYSAQLADYSSAPEPPYPKIS